MPVWALCVASGVVGAVIAVMGTNAVVIMMMARSSAAQG